MGYPKLTFELRLSFDPSLKKSKQTKQSVMTWLSTHGVDEFVEGVMDGLDIDHEYTGPDSRDFYGELGGDHLPVSIYKYSLEMLEDLKAMILRDFPDGVSAEILSMETSDWLEGWKESFRPILTKKFYIYPPWSTDGIPADKIPLVIEPGMAFGTGQHATTQVVLGELERLVDSGLSTQSARLMDVGTGTGLLAIAAYKLGFLSVAASDIDPDAVSAAQNNAALNKIRLPVWKGSAPVKGVDNDPSFEPPFGVVLANILFVVLRTIIGDLAQITKTNGVVILSGVLIEDAAEMIALAKTVQLNLIHQSELEGWACLTFSKLA